MFLPPISNEQQTIITHLQNKSNIIVDSVAGAGKTTSNIFIAKFFTTLNILLITYNSNLKTECRNKFKLLNINNVEIHSYHSFCVKYYNNKCFNDSEINSILIKKSKILQSFKYDLIILDECQDMNKIYFQLVCKIFNDNENKNCQLCILGDVKQSIYSFNEADSRYIQLADKIFLLNSYPWIKCNLSTSFRITKEMSLFINNCLLNENKIQSNKISKYKPRYIICDCFSKFNDKTFNEIIYYMDMGYHYSDFFILAPSLKSASCPARILENKLKLKVPNIMIYVPNNDDEKLDKELLKGKMIFSTFHQAKGLERKVIIVFNFDDSFFKYYNKDANPLICPNELYVAVTRGLEKLTIFHHYKNDYLPFLNKSLLKDYCIFDSKLIDLKLFKDLSNNLLINTNITDLLKHLPQYIIDNCFEYLTIKQNKLFIESKLVIQNIINNSNTIECVNDITGTAIPSMFEYKMKNEMTIYNKLLEENFENKLIDDKNKNSKRIISKKNNDLNKQFKKLDLNFISFNNLQIDELLYIANCWNSFKSGYLFKIFQIDTYDWLSKENIDECMNRLSKLNISKNSKFEYFISIQNQLELLNRKLIGNIDCFDIDNNIIYEFKCVEKIEKEHFLQLAIYMYVYEIQKYYLNINSNNYIMKYILYNILSNEYYEIKCNLNNLRSMIQYLILYKFSSKTIISDIEFIKNNLILKNKIIDYI